MKVTIGADPEFFVRRVPGDTKEYVKVMAAAKLGIKSEGVALDEYKWMPICGLLGGTKSEPQQIPGLPKGFLQQEDGAAVEFNIPPAEDIDAFTGAIQKAMRQLGKILYSRGLEATNLRTIELTKELIEKFPNLASIGCDPDFSAYKDIGQPRGQIPDVISNIRGAGGHVHIGYNKDLIPANYLVQFLDLTLALPLLEWDKQGKRRGWWGQAGVYRNKPYGLEYRSLSNFWLFDDTTTFVVGRQVFELLDSIEKNMISWQEVYNSCNWDLVSLHIQNENVKEGRILLDGMCKRNKVLGNLITIMRSAF